ncbi:hypothetical protein [Ideonella sp. BN130291]|uniref:hypothetical protein n=1 Tax=Ideonella sp. BN130291 TaxID=3112940 RepID=UPI002E255D2F|nr:hypothetical protein [Ideonella sp. BN130291]
MHQHGEVKRSRIARLARNRDSSVVAGIIQTGINGFSADLVNTITGVVSHNRTTEEAEFIPFFFLIVSPPGLDFGLLLLQKFGALGVKDFFVEPIVASFTSENPGKRLRVTRQVPSDLAVRLLQNSIIKKVKLIKYQNVGDLVDSLGRGFRENTSSIEYVLTSKTADGFPRTNRFLDALTMRRNPVALFALEGFEHDAVKIEIEVNGRKRIINLARPDIVSPVVDVTDDVTRGRDGHPTWRSLLTCFSDYAVDAYRDEGHELDIDINMVQDESARRLLRGELAVPRA